VVDATPDLLEDLLDGLPPLAGFTDVVVLTGAGLSAAAGLGTFRGAGGVWTVRPDLEEAMQGDRVPGNVPLMWQYWGGIRARAQAAGPTPAHRALARLGARIVTQNVDGLHSDAGSTGVAELHGSAARARCLDAGCGWSGPSEPFLAGEPPRCPRSGGLLRPDVVLFGEALDPAVLTAAQDAAASCDLLVTAGTSLTVAPASWLVPTARAAGAYCVDLNTDPGAGRDEAFHQHVTADVQQLLPAWVARG
jgi:NAD-dependent deacetylase